MLYLIATPIGNLSDITFRAIEVMKSCEYLLCEDTKKSQVLLNHYTIKKKLISFHQFNESTKDERVLEDLANGKDIALITDAGTPVIADPGFLLVQKCIQKEIPFTFIPGPCSIISGYLLSGLYNENFQFKGFVPKKGGEKETFFKHLLHYPGTSIVFETPHRLLETLQLLEKLDPSRQMAAVREITKMHEEAIRNIPSLLIKHFEKHPPRGEFVLVIAQNSDYKDDLSLEEMITLLCDFHGLSLKEAITASSKMKHLKKRDVYSLFCKKK